MNWQLPEIGEGVYEAELVSWLVKPGDVVKRGQNLMEVMTDKATMEVPSPFAGTIAALNGEAGQKVKVGEVVLTYTPTGQETNGGSKPADAEPSSSIRISGVLRPPPARPTPPPPVTAPASTALKVAAAPSVRLMARKLGIDLARVRGSGPQGRILIDDLTAEIGTAKPQAPAPPPVDYGTPGSKIKLAGLRRKVAEHMVHAKRTIPHYTYVDECDITELVRLREQLKEPYAKRGVKITYLAFVVKAVVAALKEVPIVNASLNDEADQITLHDRYNIGVAVAVPGGLIVPVVRDADRRDLGNIAKEIERLSSEARAGKSKLDDLRGGTFTITSVGNLGGLISTPVINHPEVAILGLGKVVKRPVYDAAGNIKPADLLYLSLSCDHRVVDGAVGAAFANVIIRELQKPAGMLVS